jgi:hypothetical protein
MDHKVEYCHSSFLFEIRLMIRYITKNMRQFNKKKGDDVDQTATDTATTTTRALPSASNGTTTASTASIHGGRLSNRTRLGSFENGSRMLLRIVECVLAVLILGLVGYALSVYKHTFVSSSFFLLSHSFSFFNADTRGYNINSFKQHIYPLS